MSPRVICTILATCWLATAAAHEIGHWQPAPNLILPQRHVIHPQPVAQAVQITGVDVSIDIRDTLATTTLTVHLHNPSSRQQEAELIMPVGAGSVVTQLHFDGLGSEPTAKIVPLEEARRIYQQIVSQMKDPAIMEFVGMNLVKSSVFPVPAHGRQQLVIGYEQVLMRDGKRCDYVLPRTSHLDHRVPWRISTTIRDRNGLASIYSPSHEIITKHRADGAATIELAAQAQHTPGPYRLSWLVDTDAVSASVIAYPDTSATDGGYFMIFAGSPERQNPTTPQRKRELQIVIDRSGSMNGNKIEQVRESAMQLIGGLEPGELFNLITYHHGVERFSEKPVIKNAETEAAARAWIAAMMPRGGTNIHGALYEALHAPPTAGSLPIVIFLTDGIATVGHTTEPEIRKLTRDDNPHQRRVFTVGVGADVNTHLLEKLADDSRAIASFVAPGADIETTIGTMFERLHGPVMTDINVIARNKTSDGSAQALGRILDLEPARLGDLFAGQQLLVTGRYTGTKACELVITGMLGDTPHEIVVPFDPAAASVSHDYVPRLWASRKIAALIDAVRELGAAGTSAHNPNDPRYRELVDEIVRLSTEFGILTEYTAFLALEPGHQDRFAFDGIPAPAAAAEASWRELERRAFGQRSGEGSLAQSLNAAERKSADKVNLGNQYVDEELSMTAVAESIQPVSNQALYRDGNRWIDSRAIVANRHRAQADRTIQLGSDSYFVLADDLARVGKQALLANAGEILLQLDNELVLIQP